MGLGKTIQTIVFLYSLYKEVYQLQPQSVVLKLLYLMYRVNLITFTHCTRSSHCFRGRRGSQDDVYGDSCRNFSGQMHLPSSTVITLVFSIQWVQHLSELSALLWLPLPSSANCTDICSSLCRKSWQYNVQSCSNAWICTILAAIFGFVYRYFLAGLFQEDIQPSGAAILHTVYMYCESMSLILVNFWVSVTCIFTPVRRCDDLGCV